MRLTNHHAKYLAYELTKRCPSDSLEKLAGALVDAKVDLNPHQVEAALFAFRSPLSKGALLADEVGLGKTIEAGLVLSQKWAERKRKVLVITPANLRKQWHQEMQEKFFLPCRILEAKSYNQEVRAGNFAPFERFDAVTICSYQFAKSKAGDIHRVPWDLVVMDEAHRLRNVYKPSNVIANTLKRALGNAPKILLTATPLQNSLLELYGLVSFIDEHAFGDVGSFGEPLEDELDRDYEALDETAEEWEDDGDQPWRLEPRLLLRGPVAPEGRLYRRRCPRSTKPAPGGPGTSVILRDDLLALATEAAFTGSIVYICIDTLYRTGASSALDDVCSECLVSRPQVGGRPEVSKQRLAFRWASAYTLRNTRAVPLARKGDAHQGRVFLRALRGAARVEAA